MPLVYHWATSSGSGRDQPRRDEASGKYEMYALSEARPEDMQIPIRRGFMVFEKSDCVLGNALSSGGRRIAEGKSVQRDEVLYVSNEDGQPHHAARAPEDTKNNSLNQHPQ